MTNPIFSRAYSLTSLYNSLAGMPEVDPLAFFQLQLTCCGEPYDTQLPENCNVTWYDSIPLISGFATNPTRGLFSRYLATNEEKIAQFLGYYPGPKLIENEVIRVQNWSRFIKTRFCNVVRAGSRKMTKISDGLPKEILVSNSVFSPFSDLYTVKLGDTLNPLEVTPECNFWVYPDGYELKDEWALRPGSIIGLEDGQLELCFPLWVAVDPANYYTWPDSSGRVKRLCICDDIFIEQVHVYQESWELPHGYVTLAKEACPLCKGNTDPTEAGACMACQLTRLPICLEPRDWAKGIFTFKPIVNIGTELEPCWEQATIEEACAFLCQDDTLKPLTARFLEQCYCTTPLDVEINYVSSCDGSWNDPCLTHDTCPELLKPLLDMTLADMILCQCGCLDDKIKMLNQDLMLLQSKQRTQAITDAMLKFGTRKGDVEAYNHLKNFLPRKKKSLSYI